MINICDMSRGMENIKNFYGCEPIEIIKIELHSSYVVDIVLCNGDEWKIGYAGQVSIVPEPHKSIVL